MEFNNLFNAYLPLVQRILTHSNNIGYRSHLLEPMPGSMTKSNYPTIMYHLYNGIIERCHITCLTSLMRNIRWLEGTNSSIHNSNIMSFSANLRGFLEASSDSWDVLQYLPNCLFQLCPFFYLVNKKNTLILDARINMNFEELENKLIHFYFARRHSKNENALPEHKNKTNAHYIRQMESSGVINNEKLYSVLCELTHPAADSINCFMDENITHLKFNIFKEKTMINGILAEYESTITGLMMHSMNSALISLAYLGRIVSGIPAPLDIELSHIGNVGLKLEKVDKFIKKLNHGEVDMATFIKNPLFWESL